MPYPWNPGEQLEAADLNAAIAAAMADSDQQWNAGTVDTLGTGLTLNSGTLAASGAAGTVTSVATGAGLTGGPITSTGTIIADWQGGIVGTIGSGLSVAAGTLNISNTTATKAYADAAIIATRLTQVVTVATTAILPNSPTYANGTAGVGATLTAGSAGALTIDGQATALGDRILVKNQASTVQNGIYSVTTAGTAGIPYVLTRLAGYDSGAEITGAPAIQIGAGTVNGFTSWIMNAGTVSTIGTDPITYVQFTVAASAVGAGTVTSITAGTGLSGGTITNSGTISLPSQPYTLAAFASGVLTASQVLLMHQHPAAVTYPSNFGASTSGGSSRAASLANATASTVLTVSQCLAASDPTNAANFGSIGSITFGAGGHAGTFTTSGTIAFAAGDFLKISGPASADATLASVAVTLVGNR